MSNNLSNFLNKLQPIEQVQSKNNLKNNILILSAYTKNIEWNNYGKNDYAEVSLKINKQYADINGYDFKGIVYDTKYKDYWPTWIKIYAILEYISMYDYVFWIDADAIFMNNIPLDFLMGKDIALTKGLPTPDIDKTLTMTTTGFMLIKNTEFSINLLNNLLYQAENWDGGSFKELNWHEQGLLDKMYIRPQVIQTYKFTFDYYRLVDHIKEDIENPFETENFKIFPQKYQVEDITDVKFIYHAAAETPTKRARLKEAYKYIDFLIDKKVFINFKSDSIGDTLAWIPYVEEFRKKHNCKVVCSTFWNSWFKDEYKEIEFVEPESTVDNLYASYEIGWFYDGVRNPIDPRTIPLQQTSSDILGLNFEEIRPKVSIPNKKRVIHEKYVCIAIQATTQIKYWNCKGGWQKVVDYLNENGYKVVCIDKHSNFGTNDCWNEMPNGVIDKTGVSIEDAMSLLYYADFHMGVSSGLSWLSWSVGTPVLLVSSWSKSFAEFQSGCVRVHCDDDDWSGSFNDDKFKLDAANWNWNPYKECKTMEDWYEFELITLQQVKSAVDEMIVKTTVDETIVETDINKVYIHFGSTSLGDSIGWIPYCLEYKKKFNVNEVVVSTSWNNLFKPVYPELTFVEPGEVVNNINKRHIIDFYGLNLKEKDLFDNPFPLKNYKECSVQGQATNCLGLEYKEIKPKIVIPDKTRRIKGKYVCIAIQSTTQAKYWNLKGGWDAIIKYLRKKGYKVMCIDQYGKFGIEGQWNSTPRGVIDNTGDFPIEDRISDINHCEFFIGTSSGLSWVAHAVGKPVVMVSGCTKPWNEFTTNVERVHNNNVCNGCWNTHQFDASNWNWCPEDKDFECSKQISFNMVKDAIDNIIGDF